MRIKIYDGAESIGGTKIYLYERGNGIFLDFGLNFQTNALYFKEFLQARSTRGINDPVEMGILPKINIYRRDLIPEDVDLSDFERIKVDAILITHAHADHFGNIGFVDFNIPIAGSPITLALIKALSDCGRMPIGMDAFYSSKREKGEDGRILESIHWRKEESLGSRGLIFTRKPSDELREFMATHPNRDRHLPFQMEDFSMLNFEVRAYDVDHSIYGATAYVIEGDITLAYTGDIRLHGERGNLTMEFAKRSKDASILIVEGTRTSREEHAYISEEDVKRRIRGDIEEAGNLIIVDFSARNFERLKEIEEVSKGERGIIITEKDFYMLYALKLGGIDLLSPYLKVYKSLKNKRDKWIESLNEATDLSDRYVDPRDIRKDPENYILAFSLYDFPNLLDIKPNGGIYIYSSTEALSEEQELDFITLNNWLKRFNFVPRGFHINKEGKPEFEKGYHASGHASPEDLKKVIGEIDPDIIIPVHTLNPEWFVKNYPEKTKKMRNGDTLEF